MAMLAEFRTERKIGMQACMCHRNSQRLIETHAVFPVRATKENPPLLQAAMRSAGDGGGENEGMENENPAGRLCVTSNSERLTLLSGCGKRK
ncbi:hypothetical protein [Herbaspirillum sp.]|jgi:hypothetical protein|uniref:hypothetical protein n=1 Tax=Herbaspirillum TaxID=963 RepID=UPI00258CE46A|nr:hypothetical protein [Herbaspirillum sp.]MCP3657493.1 hypothetical protein [Herbaspirillum sp.]MCP3949665.1 hypothetical protein [Herbaspirillum sp.]MCP4034916.1 hypothetical protein [Herbaspirillum sp.]MCP4556395.1 hypothetical protein [Herbaspirillum sp.]